MALHLTVSNSLENLIAQLCLDLQKQNTSIFQPNSIVTQTEGMNSWLKLQLAAQLGIAANYRFLKPNDLLHQVFQLLGGQYQQSLSPQNQSWLLYHFLGENEFIKRFKNVSRYYTKGGEEKDLKRLALAEKVADLFDQYQVYRPDMIRKWNKGEAKGFEHEDWQMYLWIKARAVSEGILPDKTYIADAVDTLLQDPEKQQLLKEKIPAVQFAGISVLTDFHMEFFSLIGKYIDLRFYILNPAPSIYWFEDKSEKQVAFLKKKKIFEVYEESVGNPLLTSLGKVIQNTFGLLFKHEELLNSYEEVGVVEPKEDSLLHYIQADLFYNRTNQERRILSLKEVHDGSISVNSCFTPVREVEALYNYLVHLIDKRQEQLSARDIVVMVSDIDAYAPYIKAVFQNAPYQFPFTIADESYSASDSMTEALLSVLSINHQTFKAERIIQLLDSSYIRERFGLTDIALIRKVVNHANFRFGIEGQKDDESIYVGWKHAVQRIIYGICMSGEEEFLIGDDSLFPLDILEGGESFEIVRFCYFMEVLIESVEERKQSRTLSEWVQYIEKVLNDLVFDAAQDEEEDYGVLIDQLMKYNALNTFTSEKVNYRLFHQSFKNILSHTIKSSAFASSGVTFCSLIPMRSIPFKVVALLGLNFDQFPRKEYPVSFDLIEKERRKGDRNMKEHDKHLFLETLISAQEYLYISYLGQSVKDNSSIPPSALVDELIDYVQFASKDIDVANEMIVKHPLHGFSEKYQEQNARLFSYLNKPRESKTVLGTQPKALQFDFEEVRLDSFINFLKHPVKGYFNKSLSIYYDEEEVLLRDTELFSLDYLQQWNLKRELLTIEDKHIELFRNKLVKTGALPLKNMATIAINAAEEEIASVKELFRSFSGSTEEQSLLIDIYFEESATRLTGVLNQVFDNKMIVVSWSKNEVKNLLEAYIKFLCAKASGYDIDVYYISGAKQKAFKANRLGSIDAKSKLAELLSLYMKGHHQLLSFHPDFNISPDKISTLERRTFIKAVESKCKSMYVDPYLKQKYREGYFHLEDALEQYIICAELLIKPLKELFPEYYQ